MGGIVLAAIALVTTGGVLSRWALGSPLTGDTEIVGYGTAVVLACFLPLCQWRGANVIVDFFTARASATLRAGLDRAGALLLALMLGLLAWRTGVGALDQHRYGAETMLLQWPLWPALMLMAVPMALASLMALYTAVTGRNGALPPARERRG
nr:TRAP transporter small permease [Quisquiliibacterium transsilvanicum]